MQTLFYIVEGNAPPLLSLQSSVDLDLIKLTYDVESSFRVPQVSPIDKQLIEHEYGDLLREFRPVNLAENDV